ncbi:MAG: aldo/keto reductase [Coriobacteriia bacterium]|nr:aldo/keto reductase [Coriobacteriia bacterium]
MQYREDKRSGNKLSVLGFGCMRFPNRMGVIDQEATERLIQQAYEQGVNYYDTAYAYTGSEEALGKALKKLGLRDRVHVASKLPHSRCKSIDDVERLFSTSLKRLQTSYLDYYLIHNIVDSVQWTHLVELGMEDWIARKKAEGAIRSIGFSFHGSFEEFKRTIDAYDWDFVQIQYNYMNENYQAGRAGLRLAASRGIPVIIMEPLLGGKLATGLPETARKAFELVEPDRHPATWGLRWLWDQPEVTVVLSGMNAPAQMEGNCAAADAATPGCLSLDERAAYEVVREEFGKSYKVPCTGCNYCMPCPKGISIPACFAAYNTSYSIGLFTGMFGYLTSVGAAGKDYHLVSDCIECGACKKKCPQHIDIPEELKAVRKRLEPPVLKPALGVYSKLPFSL